MIPNLELGLIEAKPLKETNAKFVKIDILKNGIMSILFTIQNIGENLPNLLKNNRRNGEWKIPKNGTRARRNTRIKKENI